MKKDSGAGTAVVFETMVVAFMLSLFLMIVFTYGTQLLTYVQISHVSRECIQEMEMYGYLTPELEASLTENLEELGLTNIDCSNSTRTKTANGEPISLNVEADFSFTVFRVDTFIRKNTSNCDFSINRTTISKSYN